MPFSTYTELQQVVASWLTRDDLGTYIPDFITLFEATAARKLKLRPMETSTTITPSSGSADLPADYLGYKRLTVTSSSRIDLQYVHPSYLQGLFPTGISDTPRFFTIEGSAVKTRSSDATGIELLYYAKTPAVSASLNWLFTNHPDAYLFGTLAESGGFTDDPDKLAMWGIRRDQVFEEIRMSDFRERGHMAMRVAGATP